MNIKLYTLLLTLIISLAAILLSPPVTRADVGDNCSVDLTSSVSDTQDWNNITILKGSDGYAWRRGTISNPVDAILLKEGQASDISALTAAKAPTQFFIYAAHETTPGVLNKPGEGVCFEGPVADDAGVATFSINARAVWGNLGKKLVLDVFYRLPQKYDELSGSTTNDNSQKQSLQIYTFILPRVVDVKLYIPPLSGSNGSGNSLNGASTKFGKWESGRSGTPTGACGERLSKAFECREEGYSGYTPAYTLDPVNIDPSLLGSNFDGVGGNPIGISNICLLCHTHNARLEPQVSNGSVPTSQLQKLSIQSKFLEIIKRLLEGKDVEITYNGYDVPASGDPFPMSQKYKIGDITPESLEQNADSNEIVKSIKTLLTGDGDRNAAAKSLFENVRANMKDKTLEETSYLYYFDVAKITDYLLQLFPKGSCDWTEDFLNIMVFWTGSTTGNYCVLSDIVEWNFWMGKTNATTFDDYNKYNIKIDTKYWQWMHGGSPLLLLSSNDPIILKPDFKDTTIVYSNKEFNDNNSWSLPAGKKQPLYYRYDFTEVFTQARAGEMCTKKANLSALTNSISKAYKLTPDETSALSRELTAEFPTSSDFVKVSLANPADIASRFSWLGNGKPLSLLQLFFEFTPGACSIESLTPPSLDIPANRDGFEVGIIE